MWNPQSPAVVVERDAASGRVYLIRHVNHPFVKPWKDDGQWDGLFDIANSYLDTLWERLEVDDRWLSDLKMVSGGPPGPGRWVFARWLRETDDERRGSYWLMRERSAKKARTVIDRTAILVASLCGRWEENDAKPVAWGGGQGLRVSAHAGPVAKNGIAQVRITGLAITLPRQSMPVRARGFRIAVAPLFERLGNKIADAFGLSNDTQLSDHGIRWPDPSDPHDDGPLFFVKTVRSPKAVPDDVSYTLASRFNKRGDIIPISSEPLTAAATVDVKADVLLQDPMSIVTPDLRFVRRPNRSWLELDKYRTREVFAGLPATSAGDGKLEDPNGDFVVANSRYVDGAASENDPKVVPPVCDDHIRTNQAAAVHAYQRAREWFGAMRRYGLLPDTYFQFVDRPIAIRYRYGVTPGSTDGRTVNAQVRWHIKAPAFGASGPLDVCFALADLQSSLGTSPLSVACDPRWGWHEFSHVLLAAATGKLEFRFAHSAGDALAAILSDPDSNLVVDAKGAALNDTPWRGATFPWVFIARRHDRSVQCGWGWTGELYRPELFAVGPQANNRRGYWAEQLLSTSLFRLYRAIGGDTTQLDYLGQLAPDRPARADAANYVAYLIMRAIKSFGAWGAVGPAHIGTLVQSLCDADAGTTAPVDTLPYTGGMVHKVVLWAFEQQGLFARPDPTSPQVAGLEDPAGVDLHIGDQRVASQGPYTPVSLKGKEWHADPKLLRVRATKSDGADEPPQRAQDNYVYVTVRNRSPRRAAKGAARATVTVWICELTGNDAPIPAFPGNGETLPTGAGSGWRRLPSRRAHNVPRAAGGKPGERDFGPYTWSASATAKAYAILVSATSTGDPSNLDTSTGLPCATGSSPIAPLVACDNNLGLRVVGVK